MKTAIMYGAGKIGRGFTGKLFANSGYDVCFLDIKRDLVDALNAKGRYTVRVLTNESSEDTTVGPVRAVYSLDDAAIEEIVNCEFLATAVGVNELPNIAPIIAKAFARRMERTGRPLDVIICENQIGAEKLMRGWIYEHLDEARRALADERLGLVAACIGLMVPPVSDELLAKDPLLLFAEPYGTLPVDKAGFKGEIPAIRGLALCDPFQYTIERKLFIHNGGHALCAYLGYEKGYEYIWQAIEDLEIYDAVKAFMLAAAEGLVGRYGEGVRQDVESNVADLLERFKNRALMDTVARVSADPVRKLRRNDRIVGAALLAEEQGVDPTPIVRGVVSALRFDRAEDPTAPALQRDLREQGIDCVLERYMGLSPQETLYKRIKRTLGD